MVEKRNIVLMALGILVVGVSCESLDTGPTGTDTDEGQVILLSHSVAPEADSVSALARHEESNGVVQGKWSLLTGCREDLCGLVRDGYFVDVDTGAGDLSGTELIHTETVALLDGKRHIPSVYSGSIKLEMARLRENIEVLLAAESELIKEHK